MDQTTAYAAITKADRQPDGTLLVTGVATDPTLDVDQQICDPEWLKQAMPAWFVSGANVRYMHQNDAVGVATKYSQEDGDKHVITAHVVDPVAVKKVETGVLKGFSIGIRNPRIRADKSAPGGILCGGTVVELSLVDRPANPACMFTMAKSARPGMVVKADEFDAATNLVRVAEFYEDVTKSADADVPEAPAPPVEAEPTEPVTPEVPAADDALVAPVVGADTDVPVVPAGEGEAAGASVTPEAPVAVEAEPVAVEAPSEPVAAPEPVVAPVEAAPVEEAAVKAATTLDEAAIRDLITKSVTDALASLRAGEIPAPVVEAEPVVEPAPVVKAAGPTDVPVDVLEHFSGRAAALGVPWMVEKQAAHDPLFLATVRNGILACLIAEAREAMRGEDETIDMGMLLRSLQTFLAWWNCEAVAGEVPASVDTPGPDLALVTVIEDPAPVSVSEPDGDGVMVVSPKAADADATKGAAPSEGCGCCDKCTHAVKAATPDPATPPPAAPVAVVLEAEHGPELVDLPKGATVATKAVTVTDAEGVTETPAEAGSKTATPDTTKAALAEAMEPVLTEVRALRAENDTLLARLGRVEKAAAPGGPVRVRPVTADQAARAGDEFRAKAAALRQIARTVNDPGLAAEAEERALAFDAKAVESGQVRAVTA